MAEETGASAAKRSKITEEHRREAARLKSLWDARAKMTQAAFGEAYALGNQTNVGHYLHARSALNIKAASAFAAELNCEIREFSPRIAEEMEKLLASGPKADGEPSNAERTRDIRRPVRVAVVGHVKGGDDGYLDEMQFPTGSGEGYVEYWTKDTGAYALRIKGDSMHPRYRAGEFVVVTPNVEAQPGQDVVVKLVNGRKLLKQLNWIRGDELQLLSINNGYAPITLPLVEVESVHRVAGSVSNDAFIEP